MLTMTPPAARRRICAGVTVSAATVTSTVSSPVESRASRSASAMGRISAGSWAPLRATDRCGPSRWIPSTPGRPAAMASRTAATARACRSGRSVMKVGRQPVVPKRRCAAATPAAPSAVGVALNRMPPPPFTCASTKPGASRPWPRSSTGTPSGTAPAGSTAAIRAAVEQHGVAVEDGIAREEPGGGEGAAHQTVSVTLRSRLGRSGSWPRVRLSASAKP